MAENHDTKPGRYPRPTVEQLNAALDDQSPRTQPQDKLAQVSALLRGDAAGQDKAAPAPGSSDEPGTPESDDTTQSRDASDTGSPDEPGEGGEGGEGEPQPLTLDSVAEALGVTNAELNKVEVRVGPDTMTLGELKAKLPELAKLEARGVEFDERVSTWELSKIDTERQILAVIDAFPPGSVPPSVMRAVEARHNQERQRQAGLLLSARPQWGDPAFKEATTEAMAKVMQKYGISKAELSTVVDHRYVLAMQDFANALDRLEKLKSAGRQQQPSGGKPPAQSTPAPNGTKPPQRHRKTEMVQRVAGILGRR